MGRSNELIRLLNMAPGFVDPNPDRSHIDGLEHNLRVATLARDWANASAPSSYSEEAVEQFRSEVIFMGLVHDLARPLSEEYHGEVIAEIVRDMVSPVVYQVLRTHGEYQAAVVHDDPARIENPHAYWHQLGQLLSAWEVESFAKVWLRETMTKAEAVTLIYQMCRGHE